MPYHGHGCLVEHPLIILCLAHTSTHARAYTQVKKHGLVRVNHGFVHWTKCKHTYIHAYGHTDIHEQYLETRMSFMQTLSKASKKGTFPRVFSTYALMNLLADTAVTYK